MENDSLTPDGSAKPENPAGPVAAAPAGSRLPATPETDAHLARISESHATWDSLDQWATACNAMTEHARKMERERDVIATNAAREIADLRVTLRQVIAYDGPGFPHGTCAQIAMDALGDENTLAEPPQVGSGDRSEA